MFSFIHAPTPCPRGPGPLGASSGLRPTPFPAVPGLCLELGEPARPPLGWALVGRSGQPISQCSRPGVSEAHRPTPQAPPLLVTRPQEPTACPQLPHHTPVRTGSWPCHPPGPCCSLAWSTPSCSPAPPTPAQAPGTVPPPPGSPAQQSMCRTAFVRCTSDHTWNRATGLTGASNPSRQAPPGWNSQAGIPHGLVVRLPTSRRPPVIEQAQHVQVCTGHGL